MIPSSKMFKNVLFIENFYARISTTKIDLQAFYAIPN